MLDEGPIHTKDVALLFCKHMPAAMSSDKDAAMSAAFKVPVIENKIFAASGPSICPML